jgi:hypothetical protein
VRYAGDKTFVLHEGIWTDTTFDSDRMETVPVAFGSDDYFSLVTTRPEWGRYFALGSKLIVVLEGTAYQVQEGDAAPLELPPAQPGASPTPPATALAGPGAGPAAAEQPVDDDGGRGPFDSLLDAIRDLWNRLVELFR